MPCHPSHVTRVSIDASTFDEICINCGHTDLVPGGWGELAKPCPNPVGQGGITLKEYYDRGKAMLQKRETEKGNNLA